MYYFISSVLLWLFAMENRMWIEKETWRFVKYEEKTFLQSGWNGLTEQKCACAYLHAVCQCPSVRACAEAVLRHIDYVQTAQLARYKYIKISSDMAAANIAAGMAAAAGWHDSAFFSALHIVTGLSASLAAALHCEMRTNVGNGVNINTLLTHYVEIIVLFG